MTPDDDDNLEATILKFRAYMTIIWICLAILASISAVSLYLKATHP